MPERIVSADSHVTLRDPDVLEHLAPRHHQDYARARASFSAEMAARLKKKPGEAPGMPSAARPWEAAERKGEFHAKERLEDMDIDGVEAEVLYTDVMCGAAFRSLEPEARRACFRAYNDAALAFAAHDLSRLLPVFIAPIFDVAEAVEEVERLARAGARAMMLPLYPLDLGAPHYSDRCYDPLWSLLSEARIPVSQHVSANDGLLQVLGYDPTPAKGIFQSLPPIFMAEVLAGWIVPGTLERFPDLRIVLVEAGLGWIPYFLERLDTMKKRHGWDHYGMLPEMPSFYWRRNMMATFEEDTYGVGQRHRLGVENLMWATDYPHPDSTWPHSQQVLETHFRDVPLDEARLMIGGNAARLYGL